MFLEGWCMHQPLFFICRKKNVPADGNRQDVKISGSPF